MRTNGTSGAVERATSWRSDNDDDNNNNNNERSSSKSKSAYCFCPSSSNRRQHCRRLLGNNDGHSTLTVGQQWTPTMPSVCAKRNCKLGLRTEESKKMASPSLSRLSPAPSFLSSPAANGLGQRTTRSSDKISISNTINRSSSSSREAPSAAPSAASQIDRTMLVNECAPSKRGRCAWRSKRAEARDQLRRKECDCRRAMALAGVALCLKTNGQEASGDAGEREKEDELEDRGRDGTKCGENQRGESAAELRWRFAESESPATRSCAQVGLKAKGARANTSTATTTITTVTPVARVADQQLDQRRQPIGRRRRKVTGQSESATCLPRELGGQEQNQRTHKQQGKCASSWRSIKSQSCSVMRAAELVFIYIFITSSIVVVPVAATNYWPLRSRAPLQPAQVAASEMDDASKTTALAFPKSRQLMIGQHYNNFSSIVPYSVLQDSDDYGGPAQEDQLLDELSDQQQQQPSANAGEEASLFKSRALLSIDSSRLGLPQMQQIKSRFNQGCVGGTKCQFFAFCWMSGGSLGASCGLLMTCCVTPSRQEIQPGFYGPVVNDPYCGRSTSKINRIVGGTDASFGQFPWQAFVQVGGSRCGGALISSRHVVTAGHCVARSQHSPSSIKVTLGDYILNSDIESIPHEVFSVVEVLLHPNFRFTPQADRYDVAVLELERAASYKDNIKPICLPQKDAGFVGRVAYVAGWGALQAGSKLRPKVLQHVAVPVIENQVCESWHRRKGIDIRIYDEMMCAGYELGQRDACQGDSGGPLMLNQFGVWYLVGIVSAGYSCAKQYQPGIYHRVSSSSDWISSNIYQQQGANK